MSHATDPAPNGQPHKCLEPHDHGLQPLTQLPRRGGVSARRWTEVHRTGGTPEESDTGLVRLLARRGVNIARDGGIVATKPGESFWAPLADARARLDRVVVDVAGPTEPEAA